MVPVIGNLQLYNGMTLGVQTEQHGLTQNSTNLINDTGCGIIWSMMKLQPSSIGVFSVLCNGTRGTGSTDVNVLTFSYCSEVGCFNQMFVPYRKHSGGEKTMLQKWQVR